MPAPTVQIRFFDVKGAAQSEYAALNRHTNRLRLERLPDDPPIPLAENIQNLHRLPPIVDLKLWAAWNPDQSEIVAQGNAAILRLEENKHLVQFDISVLPEYRRQGIGRQILGLIADVTQKNDRRLLMTNTVDRALGGAAFMTRIGAQKGLEAHSNQLRLPDLNQNLVAGWLARGQANLAEFELGFWDGPYPEEKIQAVAELYE